MFKVFRWRDGHYSFAPAESVDYDRENFVPMSADFILMEGIRMVDEWPIIEKKIPSFDIVFRAAVDPALIEVGAGGGDDAPGLARTRAARGQLHEQDPPHARRGADLPHAWTGRARCRPSSTPPGSASSRCAGPSSTS